MTTIAQLIGTNAIPEWVDDALRAQSDPEAFFPTAHGGRRRNDGKPTARGRVVAIAAAICRQCPVIEPCRKAGANEVYGVWAGEDKEARSEERRVGKECRARGA